MVKISTRLKTTCLFTSQQKSMGLSFKSLALFVLCLLAGTNVVLGQENTFDEKKQVYVQLRPALAFPVALGDNFLAEAYDTSLVAFMGEARVFFQDRLFLGVNGSFFKAEVADISKVGDFDSTNIWHNYLTGGYALMPRNNKFGLDVGAGLGYTIFTNRKGDIDFHDDGVSFMANLLTSYRMSEVVGVGAGFQLTKDFLSTDTAPELEKFFKNADILYFSVGLVFYINQ